MGHFQKKATQELVIECVIDESTIGRIKSLIFLPNNYFIKIFFFQPQFSPSVVFSLVKGYLKVHS
jgi:hypothetical protein